jgi:transcriptional regulator GlxA family with amidase domain
MGMRRPGRNFAPVMRELPRTIAQVTCQKRRVVVLTFPQTNIMTLSSILETFALVAQVQGMNIYDIDIYSLQGGSIETSTGQMILTRSLEELETSDIDTFIVSGGWGYREAVERRVLIDWISRTAKRARRVCLYGSGAFLAAEAELLQNRRVAIHECVIDEFSKRYPSVRAEARSLYLNDGPYWSTPGMSAGIDMTLALIEADLGWHVAIEIARFLVVFVKRSGNERQISLTLAHQTSNQRFERLHCWLVENVGRRLTTSDLAREAGMSVRNFSRVYTAKMGSTPRQLIESVRVEVAARALEDTDERISQIAFKCGFADEERMRRAFIRVLGVAPRLYRSQLTGRGRPEVPAARAPATRPQPISMPR